MNRDEVRTLIPMLQAFLDKMPLERKYGMSWVNDGDEFQWQEYRIKPEVVEGWVIWKYFGSMKGSKAEAETHLKELIADNSAEMFKEWRVFKVKEIIE